MRASIGLLVTLAALSALLSAPLPPARGAGVERFIDDQTVLVGELDLARIDPAALEGFLFDAIKSSGVIAPGPGATTEKEVRDSLGEMTTWLSNLKQAGATTLYLAGNAESLKLGPPVVIVPVSDEKSASVASLLYSGKADGPTGPAAERASARTVAAERLAGVGAILGNQVGRTYVKAIKPQPRADVSAALKSAGDAPAKVALTPDARTRGEMQKNLPPQLINAPSSLIWRDLKWAVLTASAPPGKASLKLVIQSADADTATQSAALANAALGVMRMRAPLTDEQAKLLTASAQNDQVVMALDEAQIATLAAALGPPLREARLKAMRVASMSNMRQILLGLIMSTNDNKGAWPEDLSAIEKYVGGKEVSARVTSNPARPNVSPAYVYVKPEAAPAMPMTTVVLYESHTEFGPGVSVGFADGHVEFVNNKARFDKLLAGEADAPASPAPAGVPAPAPPGARQ